MWLLLKTLHTNISMKLVIHSALWQYKGMAYACSDRIKILQYNDQERQSIETSLC